jgi:hypothetical protein
VQLPKAARQVVTVEHTGDEGVSSLDRVRRYICRHAVVCCRSCRLANSCAVVPCGHGTQRSAARAQMAGMACGKPALFELPSQPSSSRSCLGVVWQYPCRHAVWSQVFSVERVINQPQSSILITSRQSGGIKSWPSEFRDGVLSVAQNHDDRRRSAVTLLGRRTGSPPGRDQRASCTIDSFWCFNEDFQN